MPTPGKDEKQKDFISRCIPLVIEDGTAKDPKQAAAVCYSKWEAAKKEAKVDQGDKALLAGQESQEQMRDKLQRSIDELYRPDTSPTSAPQPYVATPWIVDTWPTMNEAVVNYDGKYYRFAYVETETGFEFQARDQWQEVEERKEWVDVLIKAGRVRESQKAGFVQDIKSRFAKLVDDMAGFFGSSEPETEDGFKGEHGIKLFKGKDKREWILVWSTNGFLDRDDETFRTKAIQEYVDRHADDETKGSFDFWHIAGTEFGTIRWQGMSGRFLAEMGTFDDTPVGNAFKAFFKANPDSHPQIAPEGWGASHEFKYRASDRNDGVYDWFEKEKTTVLPGSAAANPHNPKMEVMPVNDKQKEALKAIEDETGARGLVETVIKTGENLTKELEAAGVNFKAANEKPSGESQELEQAADADELAEMEAGDKAASKNPDDYLVAEDREKSTTWHLQVKVNGKPNHRLMGAAWAALTAPGGHRGNKYEGPQKQAAIKKLRALYKSEDMTVPGTKELAAFVKELIGTDQPHDETKEAKVEKEKEDVEVKENEEEPEVEEAEADGPGDEKPTEVEALREETVEALKVLGGEVVALRAKNEELETKIKALQGDLEAKVKETIEETPRASLRAITQSVIGRKETHVDGRTTLGKDLPEEAKAPVENSTGIPFLDNMLSSKSDLPQ